MRVEKRDATERLPFPQKPLPPIGSSPDFLTRFRSLQSWARTSLVTSDNSLVVHETKGIHHSQEGWRTRKVEAEQVRSSRLCRRVGAVTRDVPVKRLSAPSDG